MKILLQILLFIWQLPQNIVGLIMYPFIAHKSILCKRNYSTCYISKNMQGGISLGQFVYVSTYTGSKQYHVSHEIDGHTKQSKILGPFYLLIIGLPSILWATFRNKKKHPNYYAFYTESWANKCANIEDYQLMTGKWDLRAKQ